MAIGLEDLLYVLYKNKIKCNSDCLYTKETFYDYQNSGYKISKAESIYEIYSATDEDVVLLYMGNDAEANNEIKNGLVDENNNNFVALIINDTSLKVVQKTEVGGFGDIDVMLYDYKVVNDLSRSWIKYQLNNDKSYKTRILGMLDNQKNTVKKFLKEDCSSISEDIANLKRKKAQAVKEASKNIKKYKDLKKLVSSIDKEF